MRAGKIDIMDRVLYEQQKQIRKTNPDIQVIRNPTAQALPSAEMIKPFQRYQSKKSDADGIEPPVIAANHYHG